MGLAYAGSARADLLDLLMPIISDVGLEMQLVGAAALALGFIFVGTCHGDLTSLFLQTLMERDESALKSTYTRFIGLALGLLFLGKQEAVDATLETLKVIPEPASQQLSVMAQTCAYAGMIGYLS